MGKVGVIKGYYDPHAVEEEIKRFWSENKIYEKVREWSRRHEKKFIFIDGPPYPSSDIPHVGTGWNKVLKDAVLRYKRMRGYNVFDQPGYDCHGLPIEVAVEKSMGIRLKSEIEERIGIEKFIELCKDLVRRNIRSLTRWFSELGVFMDWENPYLTMNDKYIEAAWWLIKKADEQGLLTREKRVVYWCPRCSTTLAEYEVEYKNIEDPSIYVKFPVKGREKEYILIWTTTPWTLPANTFVMAHPDAIYVRVKIGGEIYILARDRLEPVMKECGIKEYTIVEEFKGRELEGLEYINPLEAIVPLQKKLSKYHKVVMAPEFVTLYEGTGLVHAAPGHGFEDFTMATRIGIREIESPIDDEGRFTGEVGKYAGRHVREANREIINDLRKLGALLHEATIIHRYPVCWRCKTPVVLRATTQWVLKVTRLKDKLIDEVKRAKWIPSWALERIMNMLVNLQDWVLSRQRYWGTPLPIWICPEGHKLVIGSVEELIRYGGRKPKELHRPWIDEVILKCPKCGKPMERVPDVIDVWFDSGVAFYASRGHPKEIPEDEVVIDFITEGHDQTRGWFFSLLRAGVIGFGKVPYKTVLVHGFALDEKGREMHKSLGNYVGVDEAIARTSRDVFRFWVLQNTQWEDLRFSWKGLEETRRDLSIAWNVFVFASTYMNMDGFDPKKYTLEEFKKHLRPEDRWILSRLNTLIENVTRAMDEYRIHDAAKMLREFIVEDLSHWYIRLIRPRVWIEENVPEKLSAYVVLYEVLKKWLIMMAPFTPFFTEKIYKEFIRPAEPDLPESIHMLEWPKPRREYIDKSLEESMEIIKRIAEASAAARMKARIKLRQPVKNIIIYTSDDKIINVVKEYRDLIIKVTNTKNIEVRDPKLIAELVSYKLEPVYSTLGPEFKSLTKRVVEELNKRPDEIARNILSKGYSELMIEGRKVRIEQRHVKIIPVYKAGYAVQETDWGSLVIDVRLTREEIAEGLARDVVRRIQVMRKMLNLPMNARIEVYMYAPEAHREFIREKTGYIAGEVRATKIILVDKAEDIDAVERGLKRQWEIQDENYIIRIVPVS